MKIIKISESEHEYILECGTKKNTISKDKNELSAKEVYELLDYKSGDKYDIQKNYGEENKDILDPIYEMLLQIKDKINQIETLENSVADELKNL